MWHFAVARIQSTLFIGSKTCEYRGDHYPDILLSTLIEIPDEEERINDNLEIY